MGNQKEIETLNKRADIVISLLIRLLSKSSFKSLQEQIDFLDSFGLKSKEVGNILNKKDSHIRKELVAVRKLKNKKK